MSDRRIFSVSPAAFPKPDAGAESTFSGVKQVAESTLGELEANRRGHPDAGKVPADSR